MEHTQALEMNAPDRYVLGQLSAAEADAFEEHYFDCPACADDVRLGMSIMEGGRRLVRQANEPVAPPVAPVVPIESRPRWNKWIPAAAVAAVMAIPINFALLMRMQNAAARVVPVAVGAVATTELYVPLPESRDATKSLELVLAEGESGLLSVDLPAAVAKYPRCEARIVHGGKVVQTHPIPSHLIKTRLNITLPDPGPGTYEVVILGFADTAGQSVEITKSEFNVRRLSSG